MSATSIHEPRLIDAGWPDSLRSGIWPRSLALWMTVVWLALFIIRPWEVLIPELADWHLERIWALSVIAVVVASGQLRLCGSSQTKTVLLFLGALATSAVFAFDTSAAWEELYKYITLVVFYFILLSVIRTPYQLFFFAASYILVMAAYLGKSEYEYFVHGAANHAMGVSRLAGIESTWGGPNAVAASTVLSLPIVCFLWRIREPFTETWPRFWQIWFPRCLALYVLLAASAVILTNSRSGMLGFVVFVFLAAMAARKASGKRFGWLPALLVLAGIWLVMPTESKDRFRSIWDPSRAPVGARSSADGRIEGLKAGVAMFQQSPVTGVGLNNFIPYRVAEMDGVSLNAHSLFGQMVGETGIVGTVAFGLLLAALLANCRRTRRLAAQQPHATAAMLAEFVAACRLAVILLLFFGVFGHNMLRFNWLWMAAFALLACRFAEDLSADQQQAPNPNGNRVGGMA